MEFRPACTTCVVISLASAKVFANACLQTSRGHERCREDMRPGTPTKEKHSSTRGVLSCMLCASRCSRPTACSGVKQSGKTAALPFGPASYTTPHSVAYWLSCSATISAAAGELVLTQTSSMTNAASGAACGANASNSHRRSQSFLHAQNNSLRSAVACFGSVYS